jgi:outer membrane protein insertion porin family
VELSRNDSGPHKNSAWKGNAIMKFLRPAGLTGLLLCLAGGVPVAPAWSQAAQPAQQANPFEAVPQAEAPKPEAPKPPQAQNPFEAVPQGGQPKPEESKPAAGAQQLETPQAAQPSQGQAVEAIEFRGSRRVPQDTLRALIFTKRGDIFNQEAMQRDFMALWNTGRFDDIRLEVEDGATGLIVRFVVTERRVVRSIKYEGTKSVTVSEILDRFKERKVGLSVESQYDPNRVQRAAVVLKEFLAERGRQFAAVEPQVRQIPPSSLEVTFNVVEGPKVKVGTIDIVGNQVFSDRRAIRAMKNLRPIGIPQSIVLENIFSKTYDSSKLEEDKDRLRNAYQEAGYFTARTLDHTVTLRDVGGKGGFKIPIFNPNKPGKRADISVPVEEGRLYKLNNINLSGFKFFRAPEELMRPLFQMEKGDVFSTEKLRKGLENMRKLYGEFGFIDFVPEPAFEPIPNSDQIDLTLTADEGKQFFVRRIEFAGNTTTRDKVIRRELLIDEGNIYNSRLWELSILRLNQLGYFETLKENESAQINRSPQTNTVDITLNVKERGKNSVGLNGGVSGIAGSFVGFNYSTNNFLGLGETLSLESQVGDRVRDVSVGFTEPYFLDRPLQLGFVVYMRRFNFDQGREISLLTGRNLTPLFEQLGTDNLMNYVQNGQGFNVSASYPLRRSFARLGLTYGYDNSNVVVNSTASRQYFEFINFQGVSGPNSLSGIKTSRITPSYSYNTVNHPITPTAGRSLFLSTEIAGSILGGNVNMIRPVVDAKYFRRGLKANHVLAFHGMASLLAGYGGKVAPPFSRTYIGGEQDIRGFEIWGVSPIAYVASEAPVQVLNDDMSARLQKRIVDGVEQFVPVTQNIPIYQLIFPGGDTQMVGNFEYRVPIVGPVTLAGFVDAGVNRIVLTNQLRMDPKRISELNGNFPQAGFDGKVRIAPGTQKMRSSVGLELQVLLPVVNAPFRIYWAYNPQIVQEILQPPIVADRSLFPNNATFLNSVATFGQPRPFFEKRSTFRFTIGRTF